MPNSYAPLMYVLAFVAVVLLAQWVSAIIFAERDRADAINRRLTMLRSNLDRNQLSGNLVRDPAGQPFGGPRLRKFNHKLAILCHQAGLAITPLRLLALTAGVAFVIWLVGLTVIAVAGKEVLLNAFVSLLGACALAIFGVWYWLAGKRAARLRKFEEQLPLALDIINRGTRAGHPVVAAVQLAAHEVEDPLRSEFSLIVDETSYGAEFKEALANFARRTGSPDAAFFSVCVSIQSETGGNLAEILDGLAHVIRGRITLGKRVKALSSEGRASAYLISALPPIMLALMVLINSQYYTSKFSDPLFWPTVIFVLLLYVGGWFMIHRIVNFKF